MRINKLLTLLLVISINLMACALAADLRSGWVLTQRSKVFGDQYLYLSPAGVKCINPRQGIGWLTRAPNWNITFFNEKSKLFYSLPASRWKQKVAERGLVPTNIVWSKVGTGSIAGLKATQYIMANTATNGNNKQIKWVSANYWLSDTIDVPPTLSQLISSACGLPTSDSVPLQLSYSNRQGQSEDLLTTYRQQAAELPDQYFSLPTNYKLAKSEVDVLMNQQNRALLNDLANDLLHDNSISDKAITKEDLNKFLRHINQ